MWIRFLNTKWLYSICLLSVLVACSKSTSNKALDNSAVTGGDASTTENAPPTAETPVIDTGDSGPTPESGQNTAKPEDILSSISGSWSSTCRDMDARSVNTSEKDIVVISLDPKGNSITLYTLFYSGSRSCEKNRFKSLDEHIFTLGETRDGHAERRTALALDLVDGKINLEKPQNVLLVFANPLDPTKKGRILFEVFDTQRTGIRLQIEEWRSFLPARLKDQDAVILQLESLSNSGKTDDRKVNYTKSQAFSRSLPEDLELIEEYLRD